MPSNYKILHAVRLTGRFTNGTPEIVTTRDNNEVVTQLDVKIDSDALPLRVESYDFDHTDASGTTHWIFKGTGGWTRGSTGTYAYIEYSNFTDGEPYEDLSMTISRDEATTSDDEDLDIEIKIKPVVDGPDES